MPGRPRRTRRSYAAACCWASWASERGMSRGWRGGTSEPRVWARQVGQAASPGIAHKTARLNEQGWILSDRALRCKELRTEKAALSASFCKGLLRPRGQCCQFVQRLLKVAHSEDPNAVRVAPRLGGVFPSRHDEDANSGVADADRLLADAADRRHGAVELDLARSRDPATVVDVLAQLLEHVERERQSRGGPADVAGVDLHAERQLDERRLIDDHADDRPTVSVAHGPHVDARLRVASPHDEPHGCARAERADDAPEVARGSHAFAVRRDDDVARLQLACGGHARVDLLDENAGRIRVDLVARSAQRNRRRDLLRTRHLPCVFLTTLL